MSDFLNNLAEGAEAVSEFVTDNTGAAGEFMEDTTEDFVDLITPDAETGTFTPAPPTGNKFYTPIHWDGLENQPNDIRRKIDDLYDPFLDMYQREYGKRSGPTTPGSSVRLRSRQSRTTTRGTTRSSAM